MLFQRDIVASALTSTYCTSGEHDGRYLISTPYRVGSLRDLFEGYYQTGDHQWYDAIRNSFSQGRGARCDVQDPHCHPTIHKIVFNQTHPYHDIRGGDVPCRKKLNRWLCVVRRERLIINREDDHSRMQTVQRKQKPGDR